MAKGINIIKKEIVKEELKKGNTYKSALLTANYSKNTAEQANKKMGIVKYSLAELAKEFDKKKITPEYVLAGLEKELQIAPKSADRIRALELLGKYLALFKDKIESDNTEQRFLNMINLYTKDKTSDEKKELKENEASKTLEERKL